MELADLVPKSDVSEFEQIGGIGVQPLQLAGVIVLINIAYVSLSTVRFILLMKGMRQLASAMSVVEVFTYLIGLNIALQNIHKPINLIAYCIGWGMGVYLGSKIEEWLALGYVTVQIIVDHGWQHIPETLRSKGYGVTSWVANGRDGQRLVMLVLARRSNEKRLFSLINEVAPKSFVVSHDMRQFRGGFWVNRLP